MVEIDTPVDPEGKDIKDLDDYKEDKEQITYRQIHFKWKSMEKVTWVPNLQRSIRGYSLVIDAPHIAKIERLAMGYLLNLQEFIVHSFKFIL